MIDFYQPIFLFCLDSFCVTTQSAKVFSIRPVLGTNPPNFVTAKVFYYTVDANFLA